MLRNQETAARAVSLIFMMAIALLSSGCASITYQQDPLERHLMSQQPEQALAVLESRDHTGRDQILYYFDKGMVLRMQGDFKGSNAALEQTKAMIQKLDAISLREQAAAVSVNDSMRSYLPPMFERAMLHTVIALNYLEQNDYNGARVEALQLDELLKQHKDDAPLPFAHYIIGLIFEANGELDEALIAYRQSYDAYHAGKGAIPPQLQQDLLRLSQHLGLNDEQKRYEEEFKLQSWPTQAELKKEGQVVAILFNGLIPRKHSEELNFQSPRDGQLHRISVPFYESRAPQIHSARMIIGDSTNSTQRLDHLDQHAYTNLSDEMPGIIVRTIARVGVKNKLVDNARDQSPLLSVALNIATFITEQADTRAWNTLPQELLITRTTVAPGSHDVEIKLDTGNSKSWHEINAAKEKIRFISWHWPNSHVTGRRPHQ
jgi:hypothetical protein